MHDYAPRPDLHEAPVNSGGWDEPWSEWTLKDTQEAARIASARISTALVSGHEKYELAWTGVAIHVAQHPHASWRDAVHAGFCEMRDELQNTKQFYGYTDNFDGIRPAFFRYWLPGRGEQYETFHEQIALHQVIDAMPSELVQILMARGASRTVAEAGENLGISKPAAEKRVKKARAMAYQLWFDGEPIPRIPVDKRKDSKAGTNCPNGHPWDVNERWQKGANGRQRYCRECNRIKLKARYQRRKEKLAA